jgi:hypothetical protein
MPQSKIRSLQLNSSDFKEIVETALGAPLNIVTPLSAGTALTLSGSPVQWTPVSGGGTGITGGDGITVTGGSPTTNPFIVAVDGTVARTDITTETFSFAGDVSLNLNDTSQAADEDIWRIGATGSSFVVATRTDADGAGISAISITRTGTAVDDITMPSPLLLTSSGEASTSVALQVQSSNPTLAFNKTDATANQGVWDVTAGTDGQLIWRTRTDAFGTGATWLTVNRTGTTVGTIALAGTSLTFNGQVVQVGSPYPAGGGGGGDFVDSGSPISVINPHSLALDNTFRVYDPGQTDYTDFYHDGTSLNIDSTNTSNISFIFSGQTDFRIGGSALDALRGNAVNIYNAANSANVQFSHATSPTGHFRIRQATGTVNYAIVEDMDLRIGTGDSVLGSPEGRYIETGLVGTEIHTTFNKVGDWKIQPSLTGPVWVTRSLGSPQFADVNTSTTNPTMRIGFGSPTTTQSEATLAILDNFGPGLVLRDTFNSRELSIRTSGLYVRYNGFWTITTDDNTGGSSYTIMSVLTNDITDVSGTTNPGPTIQWQQASHGDVRFNPRTRSSGSTDIYGFNTVEMIGFVSPTAANINIGGLTSGSNGRLYTIMNAAAGVGSPNITDIITIEHEEGTATASNRILLPGGGDVVLRPHDSIQLVYDNNIQRWRCMATTGVQQSGSPIA